MAFLKRDPGKKAQAKAYHRAYNEASDAGDAEAAETALQNLVALYPEVDWVWFDLGLLAKRRRDWAECARLNSRALDLAPAPGPENPAAWNLGIAATGMADWPTARRAWSAYGIDLPVGSGEVELDLGLVPIRLNPDPRHLGETKLLLDDREHGTEVVWCRRIDPARGVIANVPTPESGHRFGDVVLHDGEPVGSRFLGGRECPVFNELALLRRSEIPTLSVTVNCPSKDDALALEELFLDSALGAEDWTGSVLFYCKDCSDGTPDPSHKHEPQPWQPDRHFGLAATAIVATRLLGQWSAAGPGRRHETPDRVL